MAFPNHTYNLQQAGPGFPYQNTPSARLSQAATQQPLMSDPDVQILKQQLDAALKRYVDACAFFDLFIIES